MAKADYIKYKIGYALRAKRNDTPKPSFYKKAIIAIPKIAPHVKELLELHINPKVFYRYRINPPFKNPIKKYHVEIMKACASLFRCYVISKMELNEYHEPIRVYYFIGNCNYTRMAYKLFKYAATSIDISLKDTSKVYLAKNKNTREHLRRKGKTQRNIVDVKALTRAIKIEKVNIILYQILSLTRANENTYINPDYYSYLNTYILDEYKLIPKKNRYFETKYNTQQEYKSILKYYGQKPQQILNYDPIGIILKIRELEEKIGGSPR